MALLLQHADATVTIAHSKTRNIAAVALGARSVVFGDISRYFVREVSGMRWERSDEFAFSTDLTTFRAIWRGDGDLIDVTGAVKCFIGGAT